MFQEVLTMLLSPSVNEDWRESGAKFNQNSNTGLKFLPGKAPNRSKALERKKSGTLAVLGTAAGISSIKLLGVLRSHACI